MEEYQRFLKNITEKELLTSGDRVLLMLSGGADSVFLFQMLLKLKSDYPFEFAAFHLNHCLRKTASRDAEFCRKLCVDNGIEFFYEEKDISLLSKEKKESIELTARNLRYELAGRIAEEHAFNKIATAHHADDNAETLLMHLIRGSGITGLKGIGEANGKIIRPLLIFEKEEIKQYLKNNTINYVEDETNASDAYFRNRIRHSIIPELKKENPAFCKALLHLGKIAGDYEQAVGMFADKIEISTEKNTAGVDYKQFTALPSAVRYTVLQRMLRHVGITQDMKYEYAEAVNEMLKKSSEREWNIDIHGAAVKRQNDILKVSIDRDEQKPFEYCYEIEIPSVNVFPRERFTLKLDLSENFKKIYGDKYIKAVDYDKIKNKVFLRNRRNKDRFVPLGMSEQKLIGRYFIDKKLTETEKTEVPLLLDGEEIFCVIGHQIDERYKITKETKTILIIEFIKWGR